MDIIDRKPVAKQALEPPLSYTLNETCRVVGLGRTTIYQLISEGKIEIVKIGRRTLVKAASLHRLINGEV